MSPVPCPTDHGLSFSSPYFSLFVILSSGFGRLRVNFSLGIPRGASCGAAPLPPLPCSARPALLLPPASLPHQAQGFPIQSLHPGILQFSYHSWPLTELSLSRQEDWGSERWRDLPRVTQPVRGRHWVRTQEMTGLAGGRYVSLWVRHITGIVFSLQTHPAGGQTSYLALVQMRRLWTTEE